METRARFLAFAVVAATVLATGLAAQPVTTPATPTQVTSQETTDVAIDLAEWSATDSGTYFSFDVSFLSTKHVREVVITMREEFGSDEPSRFVLRPLLQRSGSLTVNLSVPRVVIPSVAPGSHVLCIVQAYRFSSIPVPIIEARAEIVVKGASSGIAPAVHDEFGGSLVSMKRMDVSVPVLDPRVDGTPWIATIESGDLGFDPGVPIRVYVARDGFPEAFVWSRPELSPDGRTILLDVGEALTDAVAQGEYVPGPGDRLVLVTNRIDVIPDDGFPGDEDSIEIFRIQN